MNKTRLLVLSFFIMFKFGLAQKTMMLSDELIQNSKPMEAKIKGIATIPKFTFGPYKIVSGKAGWIITKSHSKLFSAVTESTSSSKFSFIQQFGRDLAIANTKITENSRVEEEYLNTVFGLRLRNSERRLELLSNVNTYESEIVLSGDTTNWRMVTIDPVGSEVQENGFRGALFSSDKIFDINLVTRMQNGKVSPLAFVLGYAIMRGDEMVAAAQYSENFTLKKLVWIDERLDHSTKHILAASLAILLIRTEYLTKVWN